jgi:hypothetical protein
MFAVQLAGGGVIAVFDDQEAAIDRAASLGRRAYVFCRQAKMIVYRNW